MTDINNYDQTAKILNIVVSILSTIGSLYLIFSIQSFKVKSISLKIILMIGIGDLIYSLTNLMTWYSYQHEVVCWIEGFLKELGVCISIIWLCALAVFSYKSINDRKFIPFGYYKNCHKIAVLLCIINMGIPLIPQSTLTYGWSDQTCWVTSQNIISQPDITIYAFFFLTPIVLLTILLIVCYAIIYRKISSMPPEFLKMYNMKSLKTLWYPGGFIISFLPSTIDMLIHSITGKKYDALLYIHIVFGHSLGLINGLIYGMIRRSKQYNNVPTEKSTLMPINDETGSRGSIISDVDSEDDNAIVKEHYKVLNI